VPCCAHCQATANQFDAPVAQRDRERYQRHGPDWTTGGILRLVREAGARDASLLDIGGGIGVIPLELLRAGAASAVHVEAAPSYSAAARELLEAEARDGRVRFVTGDFADAVSTVPPADVVTLDRVVCCYPDAEGLLRAAAAHAGRLLALSYPRDRWYVRAAIRLENGVRRLRRNPFRTFVHPPEAFATTLRTAGLAPVRRESSLAWAAELWERSPAERIDG